MVKSNPNKKGDEVVQKKTSLLSSLLGFFYTKTKKILNVYLSLVVIFSFAFAFYKELKVYSLVRFAMNPLEIMFISVVDAVFLIIKLFIPVLIVAVIAKLFMLKSRKIKVQPKFKKSFKRQTLIAFVVSFIFATLFYYDVVLVAKFSPQLVKSSVELFVLFFISVLFTLSSMYGVIKGVAPVLEEKK